MKKTLGVMMLLIAVITPDFSEAWDPFLDFPLAYLEEKLSQTKKELVQYRCLQYFMIAEKRRIIDNYEKQGKKWDDDMERGYEWIREIVADHIHTLLSQERFYSRYIQEIHQKGFRSCVLLEAKTRSSPPVRAFYFGKF